MIRLMFAYTGLMGLEVGGYQDRPDWPKMGPSLLIATCLILATRTARWPANFDDKFSESGLDKEIDYAAHLAGRVLFRPSCTGTRRSSHNEKSHGTRRTMRMCRSEQSDA
jgi:hypothetical protein